MYTLDATAARQANERSKRITELGKYIGAFTRAEDVTSAKGSRGIDFTFETETRHIANFTLWTRNKQGEPIYGEMHLHALMTCLKVRNIEPTPMVIRKWDYIAQGMIDIKAPVFIELMNKPIGILLETEEYQKYKNNVPNGTGIKVIPVCFFETKTELVASEILDKKVTPVMLPKLLVTLRHRPLATPILSTHIQDPANQESFDSDIPF